MISYHNNRATGRVYSHCIATVSTFLVSLLTADMPPTKYQDNVHESKYAYLCNHLCGGREST
jgi:hypothetical protein